MVSFTYRPDVSVKLMRQNVLPLESDMILSRLVLFSEIRVMFFSEFESASLGFSKVS